MTESVVIVDYGVGNLLSVARATEACGGKPRVSGDPDAVRTARRLILPGVGAYGRCMDELERRGLAESVRHALGSGRPALGICVGMQLLLDASHEFGTHRGFGLIPGMVDPIPPRASDGTPTKVPHVGWSPIEPTPGCDWSGTLLDGVAPGSACYFVHSFAAYPRDPEARLAEVRVGGRPLAAAIRAGNVYGTQFHPEKSGRVGLAILRNFLRLGTPGALSERAGGTPHASAAGAGAR